MIWSVFASLAAIGTGFMSTLCCVGPATLYLIGLGGLDVGPWFAENRIYNVTATILLLGAAYYMEYVKNLPAPLSANVNEEGKFVERRNWRKAVLWISYGLIIAFKLLPEVVTFVYNR